MKTEQGIEIVIFSEQAEERIREIVRQEIAYDRELAAGPTEEEEDGA